MNNIFMRLLKLWIAGILLMTSTSLAAQESGNCLHFDDLPAGAIYGDQTGYAPGDLLPGAEAAPPIRLQPFHYSNGTSDFLNVLVYDKSMLNWDIGAGNIIFPSNINLEIDFSLLPDPVVEVCLEFFDGGGEENIAVNGQEVRILRDFFELLSTEAATEIAPGVTLTIERNPNVDFPAGILCLRGPIQTLLIGGQEMGIDNICYRSAPAAECRISQVAIELEPCTPNGIAYGTLRFEATGTGSEGYTVRGNGREYGSFSYDAPFPRLGPFSADGQTVYELEVFDNENPDCRNYIEFGPLDCESECLVAENLRARIINCHDDGSYDLLVDLDLLTPTTKISFELLVEGQTIGTFTAEVLPLILFKVQIPTDALQFTVEACFETGLTDANGNPVECCLTNIVDKQCPSACTIGEIEVTNIECLNNGTYNATINFRHENAGERFILHTAGGFREEFRYADLPLRLRGLPRPTDREVDVFEICSQLHENCCTRAEVELPCRDNCRLGELQLSPLRCSDDGQYFIELDLAHEATGPTFTLFLNEEPYGTFEYASLPLTIGPFPGNGLPLAFQLVDDTYSCRSRGAIEGQGCDEPACAFTDLRVHPSECENGEFLINMAFIPQNTGERGYYIFVDGDIFGPFPYSDNQLRLGPYPADGTTIYDLLLLDATNPECYAYAEVGPVNCNEECLISDFKVEIGACNPDGTYRVQVNFRAQNPGNNFFDLYLREQFIGYYPLSDLPLTIDLAIPPDPDDDHLATFSVCINDQPECCARVQAERAACDAAEDETTKVWPGDANTDRIANYLDLLNLGLAFGSQGPERQEQSTDWEGLAATNWPQYFADGTNFKHADTNGDGIISDADVEIIRHNYGRTHGTPEDLEPLPNTEVDPPVFIEWPDLNSLPSGTAVEIPIFLGSEERPLENIYGAAFRLEFDPDLFSPGSTGIHFLTSWFGEPGVNALTISKLYEQDGLVEIALSRSDQNEVSGYGPVAYFKGIIDDIAGIRRDWEFSLTRALSIDKGQHILPLVGLSTIVELPATPNRKVSREDLQRKLRLFPNPADATVNIQSAFGLPVEWVEILDSTGKLIGGRQFQTQVVTLSSLPAGVYILRLKIGPYVLHERVVKR